MKRLLRYLAAAALTLCALQAAVSAEAPVTVRLDGRNVAFTDAQPRIVDDRAFLPVRAVFEAMGAAVDFKDGVVTATRGGRTVSMTVGSTAATVTENGATTALTMDVAPFIDPALGRAYVPVRFAAQALGANVGWDGAKRAVIIVDVEKRLENALAGKSFTCLEKLAAYSAKYDDGIWSSEIAAKGVMDIDPGGFIGAAAPLKLSVPFSVEAKGLVQDGSKVEVTEKMTMDLSPLKALLPSPGDASDAETAAMVEALAAGGFTVSVRGDLTAGKLYMNVDPSAPGGALAGAADANAWYVVDLGALGEEFTELTARTRDADYKALIKGVLASVELSDADRDYAAFDALLKSVTNALSDDGFTKNGDVRATSVEREIGGITYRLALSLTVKNDAVTAYGFNAAVSGDVEDAGKLDWSIQMNVDERDKVSGSMTMDMAGAVKASFDLTGGYVKGGAAPRTQPPAGAKLVDTADFAPRLPGLGG